MAFPAAVPAAIEATAAATSAIFTGKVNPTGTIAAVATVEAPTATEQAASFAALSAVYCNICCLVR